MVTNKGFIKDYSGNRLLPITRGELVLDENGIIALKSSYFEAGKVGPDGTTNTYGLISAADLAKITGSENGGQSLGDIYDKLANINSAITVGTKTITFYDADGKTDIKIEGTPNNITLTASDNNISIDLAEINTAALSGEYFIKSMTVDKYGRVTALTSGAISDDEIPATLTKARTIENATLKNGKLLAESIVPTDPAHIASKKYVDDQFSSIATQAVGALHFGGSIDSYQGAIGKLDSTYKNYYYVITGDFDLLSDLVENAQNDTVRIKTGDTLIVKELNTADLKFVHVPSGDDITAISIQGMNSDNTAFEYKGDPQMVGPVEFHFNAPFVVTNDSQIVGISMRQVSDKYDGYLSKDDYKTFKNYSSNLSVTYTPTVSETEPGAYKIGEIQIGTAAAQTIYGVNNISSLEVKADTDVAKTPYLSFKENTTETKISIKGGNGILTNLSDDKKSIEIHANNTVDQNTSKNYLSIENGYIFSAKIGSGQYEDDDFTEGLTKYSDFAQFREAATSHITNSLKYEILTGSLVEGAKGDDKTKTYSYGSDTLKTAITFE